MSRNREGTGSEERHTGSLASIRKKGFVASIESVDNQARIVLDLSEDWLSTHRLEPASTARIVLPSALKSQVEDVLLLRKVTKLEGVNENG